MRLLSVAHTVVPFSTAQRSHLKIKQARYGFLCLHSFLESPQSWPCLMSHHGTTIHTLVYLFSLSPPLFSAGLACRRKNAGAKCLSRASF